jgi:hypothetical protein
VIGMDLERFGEGGSIRVGHEGQFKLLSCILTLFISTSMCSAIALIELPAVSEGSTDYSESFYINTPHPCPNNMDETWTITRLGSSSILVHFSSINLELGVDYIFIYDGSDNYIQSFTGQTSGDTNEVNGDTIKIRLYSDDETQSWGFRIDSISYSKQANIETQHNYANDCYQVWDVDGDYFSSKVQLHFSRINTEPSYDRVSIQDQYGNQLAQYSGGHNAFWTSVFKTDHVHVVFSSDISVTDWGFKIDQVRFFDGDMDNNPAEFACFGVGDYTILQDLDNGDADGFTDDLCMHGWDKKYDLRDGAVDDVSFDYADSADLIYFTGHGNYGLCCLNEYGDTNADEKDTLFDHDHADAYNMGSDCDWMVLSCCRALGDSDAHVEEFIEDGIHSVLGYHSPCFDTPTDDGVIEDFHEYSLHNDNTIISSWYFANINYDQGSIVAYVTWSMASLDHMWGHGAVCPDEILDEGSYYIVRYE